MHARVLKRVRGLAAVVVLGLGTALLATAQLSPAEAKLPAKAVAGPCGTAVVLKADGTPWTCTFGDDFTGSTLDTSKWFIQTTANSAYNSGGACYTDTKQNVTQSMGSLKLVARKVFKAFVCASPTGSYLTNYTAGTVSTFNRFAQAYGRFEVRAKFPSGRLPGLQSAIWMYPQENTQPWPYNGEIDIAEWYSQYPDRVIPFLHYGSSYMDPNATNTNCKVANVSGAWHTYLLEWTPQAIKISYDGKVCLTNTAVAGQYPFNKAYMLVLSQMLGTGSNAVTSRTQLPATTQIDYVRVWQ
ncbi:glycoside hydrolase family 16 protein [Nocardioides marmoriginsengisoli]|uniref:Glycoside hydrolase family 16 protein n=1 Tax=Nocardioides marmoriginsengisoli TaxID=661483 RepID=A0A3N0CP02_9ACTN|nr:glycoside hydrolase family 16 protein [Nocardioides marmoriginsengisoli]RNL65188.1 glycoside hydrolase family 16 protein [Nocardioides marmoriginsengisoli]